MQKVYIQSTYLLPNSMWIALDPPKYILSAKSIPPQNWFLLAMWIMRRMLLMKITRCAKRCILLHTVLHQIRSFPRKRTRCMTQTFQIQSLDIFITLSEFVQSYQYKEYKTQNRVTHLESARNSVSTVLFRLLWYFKWDMLRWM